MEKGDHIPKYLMKFFHYRDELGSVGITVDDDDLVSLALLWIPKSWHNYEDSDDNALVSLPLLGLLNSWHIYEDSVNGWEKLLGWERLWSDLVQEEIR